MEATSSAQIVERLRSDQRKWSTVELGQRALSAKRLASLITRESRSLHAAIQSQQRGDYRETIGAEILPMADASRWLGKNAKKILQPRAVGRWGRPLWLGRVRSVVSREPVGVVLIIGTWNYPLFLTGVQMMQALIAGNAVIVKPAPGCDEITDCLRRLMIESGIPSQLIVVLDTPVEAAQAFIDAGIDKVIMTGSSQSGRVVLTRLAQQLVPATMELSGCDAVFVLEDADLERVVAALVFGLRLNGGATCVAPRRVYVPQLRYSDLLTKLRTRLREIPPTVIPETTAERILSELRAGHAQLVQPSDVNRPLDLESTERWIRSGRPLVLESIARTCPLAQADIFAPLSMLFSYQNLEEAIQHDRKCPYGLMASIFGDEKNAKRLAGQLNVGSVTINDIIVPTADSRLPFGGVRESGYGVTRGVEGLIELTRPKVISIRRGRWLLHLDAPKSRDGQILEGLLQWMHEATWNKRMRGLWNIIRAVTIDASKQEEINGLKEPSEG